MLNFHADAIAHAVFSAAGMLSFFSLRRAHSKNAVLSVSAAQQRRKLVCGSCFTIPCRCRKSAI